jgi:hypothetical protein
MNTMTRIRSGGIALAAALTLAPLPAAAQEAAQPSAAQSDSTHEMRAHAWRPLRIAKWTTAAATAGSALYGFLNNRRADDRFEELEQVCVDAPTRCTSRLPSGAYADADLERDYQEVLAIDGRSRTALVASQIGVAATVVMFVLDLRNAGPPENIPYEPRAFDVRPARDGGLALRMTLPVGRAR